MADKTIKNPLRKRILRDIRKEKGKYISIFLFLTFMISTAIAVLVSVAISLPLSTVILKTMIVYLFRTFDIWLENVHSGTSIYVQVVIWDIVCYGLLSFLQYKKIRKIPMEEALKNRE